MINLVLLILIFVVLFATWLARRVCTRADQRLEHMDKFYAAAHTVLDDPETGPAQVELLGGCSETLGDRGTARKMLVGYLTGRIQRQQPSAELDRERRAMRPALNEKYSEALVQWFFAVTSLGIIGDIVRIRTLLRPKVRKSQAASKMQIVEPFASDLISSHRPSC